MSDDWGEEEQLSAPKYICTCIVIKDFFPETNDYLTLELDNIVYVFSKQTAKPGYWSGETRGISGIFPASHVREVKE